MRAEVLVGVAEGDRAASAACRAGSRRSRSRWRAGEGERAARILLRDGCRSCCRRTSPPNVRLWRPRPRKLSRRPGVRLVARERRQGIGEPRDAARERQARRSPVDRILIVAGDAGLAGHVGAVREVRRRLVGQARELIAQPQRQELREPVRPVDGGVDARRCWPHPRSRTRSSCRSSFADRRTCRTADCAWLSGCVTRDCTLSCRVGAQDRRLVVEAGRRRRRSAAGSSRAAPRPAG